MLTDDEYDILNRFIEGDEPAQIAEATGRQLLEVRRVVNTLASGHRTKARSLLDQQKPPSASPLTAPIVKPKPKVEPPLPARLAEEPVPEQVAAVSEAANLLRPEVAIDDLDTMDGVLAAGRDHAQHTIRVAVAKAASILADARNQIIAERQEAAVKTRIAALEAEIAALRELVAA